jgi:5-methylcytosine-specific restriction enzyme A
MGRLKTMPHRLDSVPSQLASLPVDLAGIERKRSAFDPLSPSRLSSMIKRLRGRAGMAQRRRRLAAEPLCRDCAEQGRTRASYTPDHIKPLSKGGTDDDSNIRCLCQPCHDKRTREQFGQKASRATIGPDGWPV